MKRYLKDKTTFIVSDNIKKDILFYVSNHKLLLDINFMTIEELKKRWFFDYNELTIYKLSKKYNLSYSDAIMYIEAMYYINDNYIKDTKIIKLKEMKDYLTNSNLLIYSKGFKEYLKGRNIVTSYAKTTFFNDLIFSSLNNVNYIDNEKNYKTVYKFNTLNEEVLYVANQIAQLITKGININNIKLVNVKEEYLDTLTMVFNYFNIPINLNKKTSLYDLEIVKEFIIDLKDNDKDVSLTLFKEKHNLNNKNNLIIYNKIIEVLNKFYFISNFKEDIEYLINGFKSNYLFEEKVVNCIECVDVADMYNDDNYYFFIGFNSYFPKFYKDEDYLSDNLKYALWSKKSVLINSNIKKYNIDKIKGTKNITITYKETDYFNTYLVSPLISYISDQKAQTTSINYQTSFSDKMDKINLSKSLDNYYKYCVKDDCLLTLLNEYNQKHYNSYDNSFKGIDKEEYLAFINKKIQLSYSSLDSFYKCNFKYYLDNLINEKEDNFAFFIGNLYHHVLKDIYKSDFDFERSYNSYLNERELSNKEEILLIKLKEELKKDVELLHEQYKYSNLTLMPLTEEKIEIDRKGKISVILIGFIDKIMFNSDKTQGIVVDYKTGKNTVSSDYLEYGLDMQLAVYMYLLKKSKDYADIFIIGCYLQRILENDLNKENMKLDGYTFNDLKAVNIINPEFIKGLSIKNDGTISSKKLYDKENYELIIETVGNKIEEAISCIIEAKFNINPKIVKGKNISCAYCKYSDICYHSFKDSIVLSGGEEDE